MIQVIHVHSMSIIFQLLIPFPLTVYSRIALDAVEQEKLIVKPAVCLQLKESKYFFYHIKFSLSFNF